MRHGTFVYEIGPLARECGGVGPAAARLKNLAMDHAWIRVHGYRGAFGDPAENEDFCDALRAVGIEPMAWGWCQGADGDIPREAALAIAETARYRMTTYIADVEGDGTVADSRWTVAETQAFFGEVCGPITQVGVSSFAVPELHPPTADILRAAAAAGAQIGAPQVYWFNHPSPGVAARYGARQRDPIEYAKISLAQWRRAGFGEIWMTGQAYWGEGGFTQAAAEEKLAEVLGRLGELPEIAALNWWHAGGNGMAAMSGRMRELIAEWRTLAGGQTLIPVTRERARALAGELWELAAALEAGAGV